MKAFDIAIVGGGIVGIVTALGLAKRTSLSIALIDSQPFSDQWPAVQPDYRVSAISLASKRIFSHLNVWPKIQAKQLTPYKNMYVWDELEAKIEFDCKDVNEAALGFIVADSVMRASLIETLSYQENIKIYAPLKLKSLCQLPDCVELKTEDDQLIQASLLIGADGANSWVREAAGIPLDMKSYNHTAIVTTVSTSLPHQYTAWQRFTKTGALAFLPLQDAHTSSIVWSVLPEIANVLFQQDDETFKESLDAAFMAKLGEIIRVDKRYQYPLKMRQVKNYVQPRIALVGDAAHTIHPLAGQGVNLGLLDAACLVDVINQAWNKKRNFASLATLRKYERWRKGDNLAMLKMVDILKYVFMSEAPLIQSLRNLGLNFTDRTSFLKNFFINHALGNTTDLPTLAI